MKGREEAAAVANEDRVAALAREDLDLRIEGLEARRADEDALEVARERPLARDRSAEAVDLAPVRVAAHGDRGEVEANGLPAGGRRIARRGRGLAAEDDRPGAGAEEGQIG